MFRSHMGYGWGMGFGWLLGLLVLAGLIVAIVLLVRVLSRSKAPTPTATATAATGSPKARDILDERFARGEMDAEEYQERRRALDGG